MSRISEIREVNKPQPPPGILHSTVPLYNRDETKYVIILQKKLRNGPDKNDSNNGNEHVGMQKRC